ncbi:MAG: PQQ-like beta-propeller repeat protein [Planctomycetes bacterium]|nr:PQQ-like beta-propeller repeat protein [Planctomycetota bacterium]
MKRFFITRIIPLAFALIAVFSIYQWLTMSPAKEMALRLPGNDNAPPPEAQTDSTVNLKGKLTLYDGVPSNLPGAWPGFRGKNLDAISDENIALAKTWPAAGPKVLWSLEVGEGYAGAAVLSGRVYIIDYDRENRLDAIRCLSLDDGKDIWRYTYPIKVKRNHGMSRTVPAVTDKYIVTIGPKCHVTCLDPLTGELLWFKDMVREYGTKVPPWYAGQCPLIEDGKVILAPSGDVLMAAIDCATGETVWQTPNPNKWKMSHSSIVPMNFDGQKMYLYCASGAVIAVSAEDGSVLWETKQWKIKIATVPSPLVVSDDKIFFCGGYNSGSMMMQLKKENGKIIPVELFRLEPEVFGSAQHTPILFNNHIYGVRPDEQLVCLDLEGNTNWTSTSSNKFGLGPYIIAGDAIYVLDDNGTLTLVKASPDSYQQLAQANILNGHDAWAPMAIASGRLLLRDLTEMACIDVGTP